MTTTDFEQPGNRGLGCFGQSGRGTDTAPFVKMVNDRLGLSLAYFRVEQGGMASFRELFMTPATA